MSSLLKIFRISFAIFRGLCLLLLLCGVALQFSIVQTYIINTLVINKSQSIEIEGFSGLFPFYFSFDKILLYENGQQFLSVRNLEIDWSMLEFLRHKILAIHTLKINTLEYKELAAPTPSPQKDPLPATIAFPKIPLGYISNINILKAIYKTTKKEFKYSIHGKTHHKEEGVEFYLKLNNLSTKTGSFVASLHYSFASSSIPSHLSIDIKAFEDNGVLHYLIPNLNGSINLIVRGSGSLYNFKGALTASLGGTSTLVSNIRTEQSTDKKHINIITKHTYRDQTQNYTVFGKLQTSESLSDFKVQEWKILSKQLDPINIGGRIHRRGSIFSTKDFIITASFSSSHTINTTLKGKINLKPFALDGLLQSSLTKSDKLIVALEMPFSMQDTVESLKVSLKGNGIVSDLPKEYEQYAEYKFAAHLKPKSAAALPIINFELESNDKNKLNGLLVLKDDPELSLEGQLFSTTFQLGTVLKKGSWELTGHSHPLTHQSLSIQTFKAQITPSKKMKFQAQTTVNIASKDVDLDLKGEIDIAQQFLELTSLRAVHKESFIEGKGFFNFLKNEGDLNWHLYTFNLGDILTTNEASGTASVLGQISIDEKDCLVTFSGDFHKLIYSDISANSGNLSGSVHLNNRKDVQVSLGARKASSGKTAIEEISLTTNGTLDNFTNTVVMSGFSGQAFTGNFAFSISDLSTLNVDTASINLGHHRVFLAKPTRLDYSLLSGWTAKTPIIINTNNGVLNVSGNISADALTLNAELKRVPSDLISTITNGSYFLRGDIDGKIHVHGATSNPFMSFDLTTSSALYSTHALGSFESGVLKAIFDINSDQLSMKLKGLYPLKLQLIPFAFELNENHPFEAHLITKGSLSHLQHIFDFNYDKVSGIADADIKFFGSLNHQSSKGYIVIKDGGYERQNIGLKLKDINLNFISKNGTLVLSDSVSFKDHNNRNGKIIFAKLSLGSDFIPVLSTEISSENLQIIDISQTRRGGMSALYSGTLKADGPVSKLKIFSRGSISSLEKYIGEIDDVPIFEVNEVHQNLPLAAPSLTPSSHPSANSGMTYDVDLSLERSFHIHGQGLDSTWTGQLAIEGTSEAPIYRGQFKLRDGQLRILDKFFDVQRGEIFFDGDLSPKLYIESNLPLNDIRVKIILEGDASNLQKKMTSDSDLSEQEILQKLFFNRSSTVSQSFQALNYIAASSFISSFINIGFYQQEDPITHAEREFVSLHQRFSKRTYGKVDVAINKIDTDTNRVSIAAGIQPTPKTKVEIIFSPDKNRVGAGLEWSHDF